MVEQPQGAESRRRSTGGCLKGCLVTLVIGLILVTALSIGGYLAGKRYLETQLPLWEARYPMLSVVHQFFGLDRADPFRLLKDRKRSPVEGVGDWDQLPDDLPRFPEAVKEAASLSPTTVTVYQEVAGERGALYQQELSAFRAAKWACDALGADGAICRKEERTCSLKVVDATSLLLHPVAVSEVWISCSQGPEAGDE